MYNMQPYSLLECRVYHSCVLTAPHFRTGKSIHFLLSHSKINNLNCSVLFFRLHVHVYSTQSCTYTCVHMYLNHSLQNDIPHKYHTYSKNVSLLISRQISHIIMQMIINNNLIDIILSMYCTYAVLCSRVISHTPPTPFHTKMGG